MCHSSVVQARDVSVSLKLELSSIFFNESPTHALTYYYTIASIICDKPFVEM